MALGFGPFVDITGNESFHRVTPDDVAECVNRWPYKSDTDRRFDAKRVIKSTGVADRFVLKKGTTVQGVVHELLDAWLAEAGLTEKDCGGIALSHTNYANPSDALHIAETVAQQRNISGPVLATSYGCTGFVKLVSEAIPAMKHVQNDKCLPLLFVESPTNGVDVRDPKAGPIFADGAAATGLLHDVGHKLLFASVRDIEPPVASSGPIFHSEVDDAENFFGESERKLVMRMAGNEAYENAIQVLTQATGIALERILYGGRGYSPRVFVVPHQPNGKLVKALQDMTGPELQQHFGLPKVRFVNGMWERANTVSVTIPSTIARIAELEKEDPPKQGDIVLMPAAGICIADPGSKMSQGRAAMEW